MCSDCEDRFDEMLEQPESVDAKWNCPTCGEQSFTKGSALAPQAPATLWDSAPAVVLIVGATVVAVVYMLLHR
jgi:hypothetical protein